MSAGYGTAAVWAAIVAIGAGTYAIRLSFIDLFGRVEEVPAGVETALRYVPPAVLAALAVPSVVTVGSPVPAPALDAKVLAGAVGFAVAWRTESILATLVAGMGALWLVRFVVF